MSSVDEHIKKQFRETLAIVVLHGHFTAESDYQKGWLDGYMQAYKLMTGEEQWGFIEEVNKVLDGSGKRLEV